MCGIDVRKRETKNNPLGELFQNSVFSSLVIVCGVQVTLTFNAMWQNPIFCLLEVGWESVISLPSEVVSGSLFRLLKFLSVFKLAVRFAAGSALIRRTPCLPWERSWSLRAIEHSSYVLVAPRHGAKFRGEARLALFLLSCCEFPVVCYSQRVFNMFKRSVTRTAQEELVRTQRLPLQSRPVDLDKIYCQPISSLPRPRAPGAALGMQLS